MTAARRTATGTILRAVSDTDQPVIEPVAVVEGAAVPAADAAVQPEQIERTPDCTDRDVVIAEIKAALKRRSGRTWSVTGGKGTSWGWITITVPPRRRNDYDGMTEDDAEELARLLGLKDVHHQGVVIAAGSDYRREYVARAQGRAPEVTGTPYWD